MDDCSASETLVCWEIGRRDNVQRLEHPGRGRDTSSFVAKWKHIGEQFHADRTDRQPAESQDRDGDVHMARGEAECSTHQFLLWWVLEGILIFKYPVCKIRLSESASLLCQRIKVNWFRVIENRNILLITTQQ